MYEEIKKERDGWMDEYRAARSEVERLKQERDDVALIFSHLEKELERVRNIASGEAATAEKWRQQSVKWEDYGTTLDSQYRARVDELEKESATFQARKDTLEEWLTEFRDELKATNVYHKNQALIVEINELLNWPL